MSARGLLILILVVGGLSFLAWRQSEYESTVQFEEAEPLLGQLALEDVDRVFVDHTLTETYLGFEREGGSWRMVDPVPYAADPAALKALLSALDQPARFVPESEVEAFEASFRPPRATVRVQARAESGESEELLIELGALDVDGMSQHARARGKTFRILRNLDTALDRPVTDFRSRRVLRIDPEQIVHFERTWLNEEENYPEFSFVAERRGPGWQLLAPRRATLDPFGTLLWLKGISRARVGDFVWDPPTDREVLDMAPPLERFGLDVPEVEFKWATASGIEERLLLGKHPATGRWFAMHAGSQHVWGLDGEGNGPLFEHWIEFADRALVRAFRDDIQSLVLLQGPRTVRLERDGQGWGLFTLEDGAEAIALGPADPRRVDELLGVLENSAVSEWDLELDARSLFPAGMPRFGYRVEYARALADSPTIGWFGEELPTEDGRLVHAFARPEDALAGYVPVELVEAFGVEAEELRTRELWSLEEVQLSSLELRHGDRTLAFERTQQGTWRRAGTERSATELIGVLDPLLFLRAEELLPEVPGALEDPVLVRFSGARGLEHLCTIGKAPGGGSLLVVGGGAALAAQRDLHAKLLALLR